MTIYTPITPTYLYVKQHSITGLKYLGKTTKDPYTYNGSGKHWTRHIKKHGKEHIVTLWVSNLFYDTSIVDYALQLSEENNVVESEEWSNMKPENGLDGGDTSNSPNYIKYIKTLSETNKKRKWWNDGVNQCFVEIPPTDNYIRGRMAFNNIGALIGSNIQKGKFWINNGIVEYMLKENSPIPNFFVKGRLASKAFAGCDRSSKKGVFWWNNGVIECMQVDQPSSDYTRGRLKKITMEFTE
ncbi:hypothetical protein UFOVP84_209 [uncultured Caudovirales phage]|uniref:GIY-YIG domain-containing protein n=1 Tax=uncultured Caudovirales phage TaxID=2100421 RepID=A0A6J5L1K5_9CAUD|nr:hypothetical protein UFOVP84_209 [uncultured Caudovirales phage]